MGRRSRQPRAPGEQGGKPGVAAMLARPSPLRHELAQALPERPFSIEFWDGSRLDATNGGGPTFHVRSPADVAVALKDF